METIYFYTFEKMHHWFRCPKDCLNAAINRAHTEFGGDEGEYSDDNNQLQFMEVGTITINNEKKTMEIDIEGFLAFADVECDLDPEREGTPTVIVIHNLRIDAQLKTWQKGQDAKLFFDGVKP